jgi:cytidylate kinase
MVIMLFESYGAGADYVGPRVAEQLHVPFHDQAFSSDQIEAAESAREKESLVTRVFTAMGTAHSSYEGGDVVTLQRDQHDLVTQNTDMVLREARAGGVIMGRNGALILADHPGALHVRLDGPVDVRVRRAAARSGIEEARAAKRQKREDQVRAQMSLDLYEWDPRELDQYDLVVNTGRVDLDTCVEMIVAAAKVKHAAARR